MTVHPRLVRSIPFWILVAGSVAAIGGGAYILVEKLSNMEATILDNTATGVDVYVGQIWGVFGGILLGAGVVGLALALAAAALSSAFPREPRRTAGDRDDVAPAALASEPVASEPVTSTETTAVPAAGTTEPVEPAAATSSTLESPSGDPQQR